MRIRWIPLVAALVVGLVSCGGDDAPRTDGGPATGSASASQEPDPDESVDVSKVQACSLLTEAQVQALTGSGEKFRASPGSGRCFWAVPVAGVGAYVEIRFERAEALGTISPVSGCPGSPVAGVGEAARGGTCPGTQLKVYLIAFERGVRASVLVNDPERPLTPADLSAAAKDILAKL